MRDRLILLPGWGLGVSPMEPLAAALQGLDEHLKVDIEPLPELDSSDLQDWLDELDERIPQDVWLGGWSLGGMLASELAARRGERCCGLLTLASNPCSLPMSNGRVRWRARRSMRFSPVARPIRARPSNVSLCSVLKARRIRAACRGCCSAARRIRADG
jgi:pimeloyl-ACP methyl ester carboxylesterase